MNGEYGSKGYGCDQDAMRGCAGCLKAVAVVLFTLLVLGGLWWLYGGGR